MNRRGIKREHRVAEWLPDTVVVDPALSAGTMAARVGMAIVLGAVIAGVYLFSHGQRARSRWTMAVTVVLLSGLLAMISMVIGDSVARAFGLVGALSIVRFRTVVEDTRDTAFVIFSVIVGMAVGTGLLLVALVGVPIVGLTAVALDLFERRSVASGEKGRLYTLTVRVGVGRETAAITNLIGERGTVVGVASVRTARQGTAVDLSYTVEVKEGDAAGLVLALNALEGVQEVDLSPVGPVERG